MTIKEDGKPITPQYLNDLERDRRNAPSDHLIDQLIWALGFDRDGLFYAAGRFAPELRGVDVQQVLVALRDFRITVVRQQGKQEEA